jgi:carbonic anhydrase
MLGLEIGDAHVIRNAGGRATDDAIRSATISSWLLGTREFVVIHHSNCGMTLFTDDVLHEKIRETTGIDVSDQEYLSFADPEESLREDVTRLRDLNRCHDQATATDPRAAGGSEPRSGRRW